MVSEYSELQSIAINLKFSFWPFVTIPSPVNNLSLAFTQMKPLPSVQLVLQAKAARMQWTQFIAWVDSKAQVRSQPSLYLFTACEWKTTQQRLKAQNKGTGISVAYTALSHDLVTFAQLHSSCTFADVWNYTLHVMRNFQKCNNHHKHLLQSYHNTVDFI